MGTVNEMSLEACQRSLVVKSRHTWPKDETRITKLDFSLPSIDSGLSKLGRMVLFSSLNYPGVVSKSRDCLVSRSKANFSTKVVALSMSYHSDIFVFGTTNGVLWML